MKEDCYFYNEYYHQGKVTPICKSTTELGKIIDRNACDKCSYYISNKQVYHLTINHVKWLNKIDE